jgi:hypothetical protein
MTVTVTPWATVAAPAAVADPDADRGACPTPAEIAIPAADPRR